MAKKNADKQPKNKNGENSQAVLELLQGIASKQEELSSRLGELEEVVHSGGDSGTALVKLANIYFRPEEKYLVDMSYISPLAARPIAEALALDEVTNEQVRSGKVSLNKLVITNWLHALRGVRGRLMGIGAEAMRDQVAAETNKEEGLADIEAD